MKWFGKMVWVGWFVLVVVGYVFVVGMDGMDDNFVYVWYVVFEDKFDDMCGGFDVFLFVGLCILFGIDWVVYVNGDLVVSVLVNIFDVVCMMVIQVQ